MKHSPWISWSLSDWQGVSELTKVISWELNINKIKLFTCSTDLVVGQSIAPSLKYLVLELMAQTRGGGGDELFMKGFRI